MRADRDKNRDRDKGNTRRLGLADFVVANTSNNLAQIRFLDAVQRCVPKALRELADLAKRGGDEAELQVWATRRGFTDTWALEQARDSVELWRQHPKYAGQWVTFTGGSGSWFPDFAPGPSWNPILETEYEFRARVEQYIATVKVTPGIVRTPEKRSGNEHFEWLARHHVDLWRYGRLSAQYADANGARDISAISHAIAETARLADITLRPSRGRKLT